MNRSRAWIGAAQLFWAVCGCSAPGEEHADARRAAYQAYNDALKAFEARDFPVAAVRFTAALEARGLNPDIYCSAVTKRAACWAVSGKLTEALAELEGLGPAASNMDEILALQSFILKKQGKTAESRAVFAKAKRINPRVQEFKG